MIEIKFDEKLFAEAQKVLSGIPRGVERACVSAINRTITSAKKEASVMARAEYIVKAPAVKGSITTKKASTGVLRGLFKSTGSVIKLGDFSVSQGKRGLSAQVKKGSGRKKIARAFIATAHSGFHGAMQRESNASYPLKPLYGPSVPQMIGNPKISDQISKKASDFLNHRLEHEMDALINGYWRKSI